MTAYLEEASLFLSDTEHRSRVALYFDTTFMIQLSKENIGMLKYTENEERIEIVQLQILPTYQRQGIGKYVLKDMIQRASLFKKKLGLKVLKQNPALGLYERCGFCVVNEDHYEFYMEYPF